MGDADQGPGEGGDGLWPSASYQRQVQALRAAVGRQVYLVELSVGGGEIGATLTGTPLELLAVLDFPRPDPARGLYPHLVLLDDGRGVNLGRVARISVNRPFAPGPEDILFQPGEAAAFLFRERRLSPAFIAERSRALLGRLLGHPPGEALPAPQGRPALGRDGEGDP